MKRSISYIALTTLFLNQVALANCNWKEDIKKNLDGSYIYSKECHIEVGVIGKVLDTTKQALEESKKESVELRAEVKELEESKTKLIKSIELKDLALSKADDIAMRWRDETYNQHDRLLRQQKLSKTNNWLFFGGGILAGFLSVWAAGQLDRR